MPKNSKDENKNIRIIIADEHPIVRFALKHIIKDHNMVVVAEAENGDDLLALIDGTECDVVILDITISGHPVATELVRTISARKKSPQVLIFSPPGNARLASDMLQSGASGYVTRDSEPAQILNAIHKVVTGSKYISPALAEQILFHQEKASKERPPHEILTRREYQIYLMLLDGKAIEEIASELCISRQTVGTHKTRLMQKLGLQNCIDMVRYALNHNQLS
jgi:DNA-binding NarL/FixJ family response regulator